MTSLLLLALIGGAILGSAVCMLYILWLLDRELGRRHMLLGFFFPIYAYIWAWWNARRLGLTRILLLWTLFTLAALVLAIRLELRF